MAKQQKQIAWRWSQWFALGLFLALLVVVTAACSDGVLPFITTTPTPPSAATASQAESAAQGIDMTEPVTLRYAMWDRRQAPVYQQCVDQFTERYPHISVEIEQTDWPTYWEGLQSGFADGSAPDVFVNSLVQLPSLAADGYILDLEPLVQRDDFNLDIYIGRLHNLWMRRGHRYALPKDWDTIAIAVNLDHLAAAEISLNLLSRADWNPLDGGSYERILAALSVDADGRRGTDPEFDADSVVQYGLTMAGRDGGGSLGQQQWSYLAASNGFEYTDYLYARQYHYDSHRLAETLAWFAELINEKGYHPPFELMAEQGGEALFLDGTAALMAVGSWQIASLADQAAFPLEFVRVPIGPQGRQSMINGLGDSIWVETPHPEQAWLLVQHLGSLECQLAVGQAGVVFPAIQSAVHAAQDAYAARGLDVGPFTAQGLDPTGRFLPPITENVEEIQAIMTPVIQAILEGRVDAADALAQANARVNALFD